MRVLRWVGLMIAVLAASWFLTSLSATDKTWPSADSYRPSGLKAFSDLLRSRGYQVVVSRSTRPQADKDDLLIAVRIEGVEPAGDFDSLLGRKLGVGARVLQMSLTTDFRASSVYAEGQTTTISWADGQQANLSLPNEVSRTYLPLERASSIPIAKAGAADVATLAVAGDSRSIAAAALPLTNRFIDKVDNAEFGLRLVQSLVAKGGKVVFCEAAFGDGQAPGLLDVFGGWAKAAWSQLLFLGLVIVYTLGKRFGLPRLSVLVPRGSVGLVRALDGPDQRSKFSGHALSAVTKDADWRLRRALKLPREASIHERNANIPKDLAKALAEAEVAVEKRMRPKDAYRLARRIDDLLNAFLSRRGNV